MARHLEERCIRLRTYDIRQLEGRLAKLRIDFLAHNPGLEFQRVPALDRRLGGAGTML